MLRASATFGKLLAPNTHRMNFLGTVSDDKAEVLLSYEDVSKRPYLAARPHFSPTGSNLLTAN